MLWAHKDLRTKQVALQSPDLMAVVIEFHDYLVLAVSVYIPPIRPEREGELLYSLELIRKAIENLRRQHQHRPIKLIIAGDFNRHDQLWGGNAIGASPRQGEALPIIDFMRDLDLQSKLPCGTKTYEPSRGNTT